MVEPVGQRRLESGLGAVRTLKYELAMAGDAVGTRNGGPVIRSVGLEQRYVHWKRNTRARTQPAPGSSDRLWNSCRPLPARQFYLRRHPAAQRFSRFAKTSEHRGY